jgi:hypothetical protein
MATTQIETRKSTVHTSEIRTEPLWAFESHTGKPATRGAAAIAHKCRGADSETFNGMSGNNYALATRDAENQLLPWDEIESHVRNFLQFAKSNPTLSFTVLASAQKKSLAEQEKFTDLLRNSPANVVLPGRILESLDRLSSVRIVFLDSNFNVDQDERKRVLDQYFAANQCLWNADEIEIVSFGSAQSIVSNDKFANERGFRHLIMRADPETYGDYAPQAREILSIAYATQLVCLNDPTGTRLADYAWLLARIYRSTNC